MKKHQVKFIDILVRALIVDGKRETAFKFLSKVLRTLNPVVLREQEKLSERKVKQAQKKRNRDSNFKMRGNKRSPEKEILKSSRDYKEKRPMSRKKHMPSKKGKGFRN